MWDYVGCLRNNECLALVCIRVGLGSWFSYYFVKVGRNGRVIGALRLGHLGAVSQTGDTAMEVVVSEVLLFKAFQRGRGPLSLIGLIFL